MGVLFPSLLRAGLVGLNAVFASAGAVSTVQAAEAWIPEYKSIIPHKDTKIYSAFRSPTGIVLVIDGNYRDQVTRSRFYFCPTQNVRDVSKCYELSHVMNGTSTSSLANGITHVGDNTLEPEGKTARLEGNPQSSFLKLTCPTEQIPNPRSEDPEDEVQHQGAMPIDIVAISKSDVDYLNRRLGAGQLHLMQAPDVLDHHQLYVLPDGQYLHLFHSKTHWGNADRTYIFGFIGRPDFMNPVDVEYHDGRSSPFIGYEIFPKGHLGNPDKRLGFLSLPELLSQDTPRWNQEAVHEIEEPNLSRTLNHLGLGSTLKEPPLRTPCADLSPKPLS
jgi:hypothetical protein